MMLEQKLEGCNVYGFLEASLRGTRQFPDAADLRRRRCRLTR